MNQPSLSNWIAHVFDHSVSEPAWYWESAAPEWEYNAERDANFIAETFERSGELLKSFSDAQLSQGFSYLVSSSCSDFMFSLVEPKAALTLRLRALRSFVPLFEQVMATRCSPHLSHLNELGANPLNVACYMWWDILPIHGCPDLPDRAEFDSEVLFVLKQLLLIRHDACRESALHGVSEWAFYYPDIANMVDDFLARTPDLRPELVTYAQSAKVGGVL